LGIKRHMQLQLRLDTCRQRSDEAGLYHRFAARDGHTAGDTQKAGIGADFGQRLLDRNLPPVV
jgi:hypothetical protein